MQSVVKSRADSLAPFVAPVLVVTAHPTSNIPFRQAANDHGRVTTEFILCLLILYSLYKLSKSEPPLYENLHSESHSTLWLSLTTRKVFDEAIKTKRTFSVKISRPIRSLNPSQAKSSVTVARKSNVGGDEHFPCADCPRISCWKVLCLKLKSSVFSSPLM
jgi:hypothetical protein